MRAIAPWLLVMSLALRAAGAAELYDNGPCCAAQAIFSDPDRSLLVADDVALEAAATVGGIRFFGVYADAGGAVATNSVPASDAFTLRIFADSDGQPGALIGTSELSGSRAETGETLGRTGLRWHRYEMNLDLPIAVGPGIVWVAVSNDTSADTDDDWAWGQTNNDPQLALSTDEGATWESTGRNGNLAFTLFDEAGVTSLRITQLVLDQSAQEVAAAEVGSRLTYHLEIVNNSGVTATDVAISDLLPEEVLLIDVASTPSIAPVIVERSVRWDIDTLPGTAPDNAFVADLTIDVAATAADRIVTNRLSIEGAAAPFAAGASASASFDGVSSAPVTIEKTVSRGGSPTGVAAVGDRLTYTIAVTNADAAPHDVTVTDVLPGGTSYVADSGGYDPGTGIWAVGTLGTAPPDNAASLTIDVDVLAAADGTTVTNTATISAFDGTSVNIPEAASVASFGADLALEAAGVRSTAGQAITDVPGGASGFFRFRLTNNGPEPTASVATVAFREDYLPALNYAGFATIAVFDSPDFSGDSREPTGSTGSTCTLAAGVWTCPLERPGGRNLLDPGESISFEIRILSPGVVQDVGLTVAAAVSSETPDPVAANGTAAHDVTVLQVEVPDIGDGSDSRCFIATAAYGSYLEPEVELLRRFRDRHLLANAPGRAFVAWYYAHSPGVAAWIAPRPAARAVIRWLLSPVVYAIKYPGPAAALLACGVLLLGRRHGREIVARGASRRSPL